jgi:hypothetical protein
MRAAILARRGADTPRSSPALARIIREKTAPAGPADQREEIDHAAAPSRSPRQ